MPTLTFEDSSVDYILEMFDKTVDDAGYIVEQDTGERVLTPEGEEITVDELGIIADGSEMFIKDNYVSLLQYVKEHRNA